MSEPANNATPAEKPGFPYATVAVSLVVMLGFLALTWGEAEYRVLSNAFRGEPKPEIKAESKEEPQLDPAAKLAEVNDRNDKALKGVGAKMSRDEARAKLLTKLKGPNDALPFPTPEPAKKEEKKDAAKEGKKEEKKGEKGKGDEP